MNAEQLRLFRCGYSRAAAIAESAAALVLARLVESDASSRRPFRGDIGEQGAMLLQALDMALRHRHQPGRVQAALRALTRQHASPLAREIHYDAVCRALVWIVREGATTATSPAIRDSWTQAGNELPAVFDDSHGHFERVA